MSTASGHNAIPHFVYEALDSLLDEGQYGFAPVKSGVFSCAIVLILPHSQRMEQYDEERFHAFMERDRQTLSEKVQALSAVLTEHGIVNTAPPPSQRDEIDLVADFSFKYAAVQAGLGFIGKNDLFVSERYGARVRLCALLTALPPVPASPCPLPAGPATVACAPVHTAASPERNGRRGRSGRS